LHRIRMNSEFSAPSRTPKKLNALINKLIALPDVDSRAMQAVLNLLNPFPDGDVVPMGWPDSKSVSSVVLVDTQETTITNPVGLTTGQTWDCHVGISPYTLDINAGGSSGKGQFDGSYVALATNTAVGPYFVLTGASGTNMAPNNATGLTNPFHAGYGQLSEKNMFRVVAQAIEVVNTSAELYRGGMAYGYRTPTMPHVSTVVSGLGVAGSTSLSRSVTCNLPPRNAGGVVNFKNTYEGSAADGLYVINTPDGIVNEPMQGTGCQTIMLESPSEPSSFGYTFVRCGPHTNWNHIGGFLTGLAQGSSLVVRFRTYMEIFPTVGNAQEPTALVRLSGRTVPRSYVIDEILTRVLSDMPAGTAYSENPLGEWFQKILQAVASMAPVIGSALAPVFPPAALIGSGLGMAANGIGKLTAPKKKLKEQIVGSEVSKRSVFAPSKRDKLKPLLIGN